MPDVLPMSPTCCMIDVLGLGPTLIHSYTKIYHTTTNDLTDTNLHTGTRRANYPQTTLRVSRGTCYCFSHTGMPCTVQEVIIIIITAAAVMIANV